MDKELYHPYMNDNKKMVRGAAALNHYIFTEKGSLQAYHDEIGEEYIKAFVKSASNDINANLAKKAKRKKFKVV